MRIFGSGLILLAVWAMSSLCLAGWALNPGFGPGQYPGSTQYGIGVYFAPERLPVYAHPTTTESPIDVLEWRATNNGLVVRSALEGTSYPAQKRFIAFYPKFKLALLPVVQENGLGWAEVIIQPQRNTTAWVPLRETFQPSDTANWPAHWGQFQPWIDFMRANARTAGITWLYGTKDYDRQLKMQPKDDATLLDVTLIRKVKVHHARGNWLLVEAWDFNRESPIGWVRWRDDEGRLMVFPNFAEKKDAMIPGLF